jgi:hypothetical protein
MENEQRTREEIQFERQLLPLRLLVYLITSSLLVLGFVTSTGLFVQRLIATIGLFACVTAFLHFFPIHLRLRRLEGKLKLRPLDETEGRNWLSKAFGGRTLGWLSFPFGFGVLWSLALVSTIFHWQ